MVAQTNNKNKLNLTKLN